VRWLLPIPFLGLALLAGIAIRDAAEEGSDALVPVGESLEQVRSLAADYLFLKIDQYHHMWIYEGNDWTSIPEYLPLIWLIVELKPDFREAYSDGSYQLAVNLGYVDEGLELISEGIRNCPGDPGLRWDKLVIVWQTGAGNPQERRVAGWDLAGLIRRECPSSRPSLAERNSLYVISWLYEADSTRARAGRLESRYSTRARIAADQRALWRY
jgi:hypothetical protein